MKLNKRAVALLISLAILVVVAVGVTIAFVFTKSDTVNNTFTPAKVTCQVVNKGSNTYTVENTYDPDACDVYVRVAVLVNWKSTTGFYAQAPDFEVIPDTGWVKGSDGYYYFTKALAVGTETATNLTVKMADGVQKPEGYDLSVEVVASAIQTTSDAVKDWSNGVATATTDGGDLAVKTQ